MGYGRGVGSHHGSHEPPEVVLRYLKLEINLLQLTDGILYQMIHILSMNVRPLPLTSSWGLAEHIYGRNVPMAS